MLYLCTAKKQNDNSIIKGFNFMENEISNVSNNIMNENEEKINDIKDDLFNDASDLFKNGKQKIKEKSYSYLLFICYRYHC